MLQAESRLRICVIGAGAAGLCALRHLANDLATFEPAAYEQMNNLGGTWVYDENVGVDVHSSMYENLRTNLPGKLMNFPDWKKMGGGPESCITHDQVLSYLENYANHFDICKYIQFNSRIESVRVDAQTAGIANSNHSSLSPTIWKVKIRNTVTQIIEEKEFDAVICCNGHLFKPYTPAIPGMESFSGQVLHSHNYRKPDSFINKTVILLGASSSGVDIGIELTEHANRVYLSHNKPRLTSTLPANMTEVTGIVRVEGNRFFFKDGTSVLADMFMYCTGYNYNFPFLDKSCKITVEDNYIRPLYRHMINVEYPTMCFIGIPGVIIPFPLFHMQAQYFIALLKGTASLPSKEIMLEDSTCKTPNKRHAHQLANKQWDYNNSLATDGHFDPIPPMYKAGYTAWTANRNQNLWHYKEAKFIVSDDGNSVQIILNGNNISS